MKSGNAATSVVQCWIVSNRMPELSTAPIYDVTVSLSGLDQLFTMVGIPAKKSAAMAADDGHDTVAGGQPGRRAGERHGAAGVVEAPDPPHSSSVVKGAR